MAAGLRDLLALQGVIPLSAVVSTATPGLTVGQASGVWIGGATTNTAVPGLTLGQVSGVWITGGDGTTVVVTAGLTLNQLMGVWVSASTNAPIVIEDQGGGGSGKMALLLREDQEIIDIITAIGPILVRMI